MKLKKSFSRHLGEEVDTEYLNQRRKSLGLAILVVVMMHLDEIGEDTFVVYWRLRRAWFERRRRHPQRRLVQPLLFTGIPERMHEPA